MGLTPYQILGIIPPVSMAELKAAYRKAAALHHPDLGGSHQMMVNVNDAYEQAKRLVTLTTSQQNRYHQRQPKPEPYHQPKPTPKPDSAYQIWTEYIDDLIFIQEMNDYKKAWLMFQLLECKVKPPIEAWQYLAGKLGYKKGWAFFKFNDWDSTSIDRDLA